MGLEHLTSYTWPTTQFPLAGLCVRVDELAARLGVTIHTWVEDGLGPARGFGGRLPSGTVVLLEELETSIEHGYSQGPGVYVDASVMASVGPEALVAELLAELGLSRSDLEYAANEQNRQGAIELMAKWYAVDPALRQQGHG